MSRLNLNFAEEPHQPRATLESKGLSERETEVLAWVARGKMNSEIGLILNISPRTVSKHLEHIFSKLGVETRTAAVVQFLEMVLYRKVDEGPLSLARKKENLSSPRQSI